MKKQTKNIFKTIAIVIVFVFAANAAISQDKAGLGMNIGAGYSTSKSPAVQVSLYGDIVRINTGYTEYGEEKKLNILGVSGGMIVEAKANKPAYFYGAINTEIPIGSISIRPYYGRAFRLYNTSDEKENYSVNMYGAEIRKGKLFLNVCSTNNRIIFTSGVTFDFSELFNE